MKTFLPPVFLLVTRRIMLPAALFALLFVQAGCDDPDQIGLDLLPATDRLDANYTDTFSVFSRTITGDSLITNSGFLTSLLGSYADPVFGRTDASIYSQVWLSTTPNLGDTTEVLTPDSLVLTLQYYPSVYGNKSTPMKVTVYRLTEDMSTDSVYHTNKTFATEAIPIGSTTFIPRPTDSVNVSGFMSAPHLRIRLSDQLASDILALNGSDTLKSSATWLKYFKGIYIKIEPVNAVNEGSICNFYLNGLFSSMWLYYHSNTPDDDSLRYYFPLTGARVNRFDHDYTNSDAGRQIADSLFNDSLAYIQSMAGSRARIEIPNLKDLVKDGPVVVNKAELVFPARSSGSEIYGMPTSLNLLASDSLGRSALTIDYLSESAFYGGGYNATDQAYTFNITRQIQFILDGAVSNHGFYLSIPYIVTSTGQVFVQPNRVVVSGAKNVTQPIRLKVSFTRLD